MGVSGRVGGVERHGPPRHSFSLGLVLGGRLDGENQRVRVRARVNVRVRVRVRVIGLGGENQRAVASISPLVERRARSAHSA